MAEHRFSAIWIVCDALGARHLGTYGSERPTSPRIDAFARDALVFSRAYAQWPSTLPSTASFLTGRYPLRTASWFHVEGPTLATLLQARGFHTLGYSENPYVSEAFGFDEGFDEFHAFAPASVADLDPSKTRQTVDQILAKVRDLPRTRPVFLYAHLLPPHSPYTPPAPYAGRFLPVSERIIDGSSQATQRILRGVHAPSPSELAQLEALYDENIAYVDSQVGRLLEGLSRHGWIEDSIVILSSDHGEAFGEHGRFMHGTDLHEVQIHVPLIIRFPDVLQVDPGRWPDPVELVDVVPTILRALNQRGPPGTDGSSLLSVADGTSDGIARSWLHGSTGTRSTVIWKQHKLVSTDQGQRLFDLDADPREVRDLARQNPALVERLSALRKYVEMEQPPAPADVDLDTRRALEALGYVEPEASP